MGNDKIKYRFKMKLKINIKAPEWLNYIFSLDLHDLIEQRDIGPRSKSIRIKYFVSIITASITTTKCTKSENKQNNIFTQINLRNLSSMLHEQLLRAIKTNTPLTEMVDETSINHGV